MQLCMADTARTLFPLWRPQLLGYDRTTTPDGVVQKLSISSVSDVLRSAMVQRRLCDEECTRPILNTKSLHALCFRFEETCQISLHFLWTEGMRKVTINAEAWASHLVMGKNYNGSLQRSVGV
jgi:hypothetical protein